MSCAFVTAFAMACDVLFLSLFRAPKSVMYNSSHLLKSGTLMGGILNGASTFIFLMITLESSPLLESSFLKAAAIIQVTTIRKTTYFFICAVLSFYGTKVAPQIIMVR